MGDFISENPHSRIAVVLASLAFGVERNEKLRGRKPNLSGNNPAARTARFSFFLQRSDESKECPRLRIIEFGAKLWHFALDTILDDRDDALVRLRHAMQIRSFVATRIDAMTMGTIEHEQFIALVRG